jgi:hypothetical protein
VMVPARHHAGLSANQPGPQFVRTEGLLPIHPRRWRPLCPFVRTNDPDLSLPHLDADLLLPLDARLPLNSPPRWRIAQRSIKTTRQRSAAGAGHCAIVKGLGS